MSEVKIGIESTFVLGGRFWHVDLVVDESVERVVAEVKRSHGISNVARGLSQLEWYMRAASANSGILFLYSEDGRDFVSAEKVVGGDKKILIVHPEGLKLWSVSPMMVLPEGRRYCSECCCICGINGVFTTYCVGDDRKCILGLLRVGPFVLTIGGRYTRWIYAKHGKSDLIVTAPFCKQVRHLCRTMSPVTPSTGGPTKIDFNERTDKAALRLGVDVPNDETLPVWLKGPTQPQSSSLVPNSRFPEAAWMPFLPRRVARPLPMAALTEN